MKSEYFYLINLGVILLAANIGGIISKKLKQPAVLGQILVGVILGAGIMVKTELITHMAEIGVIFLMFIAGLETDVNELKESSKSSSLIALGGVIVPLALVGGGTYLLTHDIIMSVFMGIISTATSVSISVQTLRELGQLRSRQGISILGAAIIDDIVGIVLLTLVVGIVSPASGNNIFFVLGKIILFFVMTFVLGIVITKLIKTYNMKINLDDKIVTYAVVICFFLAFMSEELGVAAITGAYFSGVVFSMTPHRHKVSHDINKVATLLFTPVFFVSIGMGVDLKSAASAIGLGSIIIVLAILGKIIGSGFGALLSGFNKAKALQIGFGMVPRAEVAIIIANLGMRLGLIGEQEIATVILMVLVTTIVTPSLLKWSFSRVES
jgi:Kef-type K+ transport system membrane component KefB